MPVTHADIETAYQSLSTKWNEPNPEWTSGFDVRSSENNLMLSFYGAIINAEAHEWLNAGRRLIDKTDISMLWQAKQLTAMTAVTSERIAASLDDYLQRYIAEQWNELSQLNEEDKAIRADAFITKASNDLFGSLNSKVAASQLLFFMFPQLPIYPFSQGHQKSLKQLGYSLSSNSYQDYSIAFKQLLHDVQHHFEALELLPSKTGNTKQLQLITDMLKQSDWQQRRLVDEVIRNHAGDRNSLGCTDNGQ